MSRIFQNYALAFAAVLTAAGLPGGSITTIDVPGAVSTYLSGISNSGVAVGFYNTPSATYGLEVLPGGTLVYPFADPSDASSSTLFFGINNAGTIVGQYGTFFRTSFILSGGSYSTFSVPGCSAAGEMGISGINDSGAVTGDCSPTSTVPQNGYVQTSGNSPVLFSPPGSTIVLTRAINDLGQIAGEYFVAAGNPAGYGYIRNADGTYTVLLYPGAFQTEVNEVNDLGFLVGIWQDVDGGVFQAFYGTPGNLIPFTIPNAQASDLYGINDSGQVVGDYVDANGKTHAFISSVAVPEPSSILLCGIALMAVTLLIMGRRT